MEFNYLVNQNCVELMNSMDENSVDLTVTSPPYDQLRNYEGYDFDFKSIADGLFRITKEGGIVVWVVGDKIKNGNKSLTSFKQAIYFQGIGAYVEELLKEKKEEEKLAFQHVIWKLKIT